MRHFMFEDRPYRINPRFRRRRNEQDSAAALARLLRMLGGPKRRGGGTGGYGPVRTTRADTRQKCVVKMNYSGSLAAHRVQLDEYLVREGAGIGGGRPELYGTDIGEYRENMVGRNFRIFISPQSDRVDLEGLTRRFVRKLEQQTGYRFHWQAANHYNTAHPHAHLLINGVDRDGKEIDRIHPDIVRTFMREYARDICTSQVGHRTREEVAVDRERELGARRHTRLDDRIAALCGGGTRVDMGGQVKDRQRVLARLENLRGMGLCEYRDGAYHLSPRWEEDLLANGRYNAFLKARSELRQTDPASLKVYTGDQGTITGTVTKIYRPEDDSSNDHAVVIEGPGGKAWFVPLYRNPKIHTDGGTNLQEGEQVTLKTYANQQGRLTPVIFGRRQ